MLLVPGSTLPPCPARPADLATNPEEPEHADASGTTSGPVGPRWSLVLCPRTLVCWTQALCPEAELVIAEPTTLHYRLWHTAGRLVRHGRRLVWSRGSNGRWLSS